MPDMYGQEALEKKHISVNGIPLAYSETGCGEPLVFLHGWGCSGAFFANAARELSGIRHCYLLDLPAFGDTPEPPESFGIEGYAAFVADAMTALSIPSADLVGHSFGGRLCILLGAEYPTRVRRMVITGGAGLLAKRSLAYRMRVMKYKFGKKLLKSRFLTGLVLRLGVDLEAMATNAGSDDYRALSASMKKVFVRVVNTDLAPYLRSIKAPTLLVWGDADTETPLYMGRRMEKEIPDAGLVVFKGCGHFAYAEQSGRFAHILNAFFGG